MHLVSLLHLTRNFFFSFFYFFLLFFLLSTGQEPREYTGWFVGGKKRPGADFALISWGGSEEWRWQESLTAQPRQNWTGATSLDQSMNDFGDSSLYQTHIEGGRHGLCPGDSSISGEAWQKCSCLGCCHITGLRLVSATGGCREGRRAGKEAEWSCPGILHREDARFIPGVPLGLTGRSQAGKV